jgi:hypothetical protein
VNDQDRYVFATLVHCPKCQGTRHRGVRSVCTEALRLPQPDGTESVIELRREMHTKCKGCGHKFKSIFE